MLAGDSTDGVIVSSFFGMHDMTAVLTPCSRDGPLPDCLGCGGHTSLPVLPVPVHLPVGPQGSRLHAVFDAGEPLAPLVGGAFALHDLKEGLQVL
jgi:hypothetical protein